MSETVKPTIAALRAWLKTCPLIADEQEATGAASNPSAAERAFIIAPKREVWIWSLKK